LPLIPAVKIDWYVAPLEDFVLLTHPLHDHVFLLPAVDTDRDKKALSLLLKRRLLEMVYPPAAAAADERSSKAFAFPGTPMA